MAPVTAFLRNSWRTLTAMRTALILLFLLAVAAIPGALLPQRSLNQGNVNQYIADNGWLGEFFDKLQLFDVFSSWWFTAVYVLLFISLVGCLTPRSIDLVKQLKAPPPLAPRNLARLPHHAAYRTTATPEQAADQVQKSLKGWRVRRNNGDGRVSGSIELSAERGYAREVGNIVFHFGLLFLLIAFAAGKFVYAEGMRVIIANEESPAFCNTTP
ncbi:putative cytochrome c biogenesis protein ResB, partial [Dietzia cinnamea P4]